MVRELRPIMTLDHLWAGWRGEYIETVGSDEGIASHSGPKCVFCRIYAASADGTGVSDDETNIVHHGPCTKAILNAYPYTSGHLMVMPSRHVGELEDLTNDEHAELWGMVTAAVRALKVAYSPEGINVGLNLGRASGAGVPGHLHVHVVPRWNGDTNFMTTTANARVLPEALSRSRQKLVEAWPRRDGTQSLVNGLPTR